MSSKNNISELERIREAFNSVVDKEQELNRISSLKESVEELSIPELKQVYESISDKLYATDGGKKLLSKYIKLVTENKTMQTEYVIVNGIYSPMDVMDTPMYIAELFDIHGKRDKEYKAKKGQVVDLLKECIDMVNMSSYDLENIINESKNDVNSSIEYLLSIKRTASNVNDRVKSMKLLEGKVNDANIVNESIVDNRKASELVNDLSNITDGLEEWQKRVVNDISKYILENKTKEDLFNDYKTECINTINESINNTEDGNFETVSQLKGMVSQLSEKKYNKETVNEDLFMLSELRQTLI